MRRLLQRLRNALAPTRAEDELALGADLPARRASRLDPLTALRYE